MAPLLGLTPKDQVTQVFDPGFDLSLHDMIMCWDAGACLTPLPAALQFRPGEAVRALGINVWFSVPSTISVMAGLGQLKPELLGGLRLSLFCGEALNMRDVALWSAAVQGGRILNLYGPTEATIAASAHEVTERDKIHLTAPIGQPLPHIDYVLLDPESGEISEQVEGELGIAGSQLAIGYWDDPELTAKRFPVLRDATGTRRVYRTGDRVTRIDGAGYLYLGRLDNEIKIAGAYRLNLLEVESAVVAASGARSCAVVVSEGRSRARSKLTAFVVDAKVSDQEIREFLRQNYPIYMIPETIRRTPALPVLPNGKVDRRALTRLADAEVEKSGTC
jgi:acyl-coenzyme A synthetase/AMP-(fatty) acid ligase